MCQWLPRRKPSGRPDGFPNAKAKAQAAQGKVPGRTVGPVGYLARELSHEFPALHKELQTGG